MRRKIYEFSFSEKEQPKLSQSSTGKWEKDSNNKKCVVLPLRTLKKSVVNSYFKEAIKTFNNFDMDGNLFLIKQNLSKNEIKVTIMLSDGFGGKLVGEIAK